MHDFPPSLTVRERLWAAIQTKKETVVVVSHSFAGILGGPDYCALELIDQHGSKAGNLGVHREPRIRGEHTVERAVKPFVQLLPETTPSTIIEFGRNSFGRELVRCDQWEHSSQEQG